MSVRDSLRRRLTGAETAEPRRKPLSKHTFEECVAVAGDDFEALSAARLRGLVEVREPLVLVSQVQRSGGTLLSQLFDGHPECHAHPGELRIGYPKKSTWPELDLAAGPESWLDVLFERSTVVYLREGYHKPGQLDAAAAGHDRLPWVFSLRLMRTIFEHCAQGWQAATVRDVLDCYMTAYFNAWLDNQNLYAGPKRAVTAFTAALGTDLVNIERFFDAYPGGTLLSLVREPRSWYASAAAYKERFADLEPALAEWEASVEAGIAARTRWPGRARLLSFEQLVLDTEATMRRVADWAGLSFTSELLEPTFNGRPIRADSSFRVQSYGILRDRAETWRTRLAPEVAARIEERLGPLHARAAALYD